MLHVASKYLPNICHGGFKLLSCDIWDTNSPTGFYDIRQARDEGSPGEGEIQPSPSVLGVCGTDVKLTSQKKENQRSPQQTQGTAVLGACTPIELGASETDPASLKASLEKNLSLS